MSGKRYYLRVDSASPSWPDGFISWHLTTLDEINGEAQATIAALTAQRDRLAAALRGMVDGTTTYKDDQGYVTCVYCERWVDYRHQYDPIFHTDDCPWLLAKAALEGVEKGGKNG